MITWKTEKRKISQLKPAPYNPRKSSKQQFDQLRKSIDKFSIADPLIINTDDTVIRGHFRLKVLKEDPALKEVDVRVPNRKLNPEEEKELNLRLNKNVGEWDFDLLANFDEEILTEIGFDIPSFESSILEDQSKLNEKQKIECPQCGHKFTP